MYTKGKGKSVTDLNIRPTTILLLHVVPPPEHLTIFCCMSQRHLRHSCNKEHTSLTITLLHVSLPPEAVMQWRAAITYHIFVACVTATWDSHTMMSKNHSPYLCCMCCCHLRQSCNEEQPSLTISLLHVSLPPDETVIQCRINIAISFTACVTATWGSHTMMRKHHSPYLCCMCHCHLRQSCNEEQTSLTISLLHVSLPPEAVMQWRTNITYYIFAACVTAT